jgi:CubicO group peptidase (beta-lactamase class C family)
MYRPGETPRTGRSVCRHRRDLRRNMRFMSVFSAFRHQARRYNSPLMLDFGDLGRPASRLALCSIAMLLLAGTSCVNAGSQPLLALAQQSAAPLVHASDKGRAFTVRFPVSDTVEQGLGQRLDREISRVAEHGFSGAILVGTSNRIILAKGYGFADRRARRLFTSRTVYDMGSITKNFTAGAIMKLQMQGKLQVSDRIDKFFSDVPADKRAITIEQLLTHSAGLVDSLGDDYTDQVTRDQFVQRALHSALIHKPGERYDYSNVGYSLLGIIIEITSGKSYESYLREALFEPAGMTETGYVLAHWDRRRLTHTYLEGADNGTALDHPWASDGPYWNLKTNGGLLTTLSDMYRWHLALLGDSIFPPSVLADYLAPRVHQVSKDGYYGYGWVVLKSQHGTRLVHHDGGDEYFLSRFNRYLDDDIVVIWTTNDVNRLSKVTEELKLPRFDKWLEQLIFDRVTQ